MENDYRLAGVDTIRDLFRSQDRLCLCVDGRVDGMLTTSMEDVEERDI